MVSLLHSLVSPASTALNSFQDLFNAYGETISQLNLPIDLEEAKKRTWSVWTYLPAVVSGGLSVAQAVGCVVQAILGNTPMAVMHGVSACVSGYAAVCLVNYIPLMALEGYARILGEKGRSLQGVVRNLQSENKDLRTTTDSLKIESEKNKKALQNQEKKLQDTLSSFDTTTQKLLEAQTKVASLQKLLDGFEKATGNVSDKLSQFVNQNKRLSITSEELGKEVVLLQQAKIALDLSTVEVADEIGNLRETREKAEMTANKLQDQFVQMMNLLVNFRQENERARNEIEQLKKTSTKIESSSTTALQAANLMGQKAHEMESQIEQMERIAKRIEEKQKKQPKDSIQDPSTSQSSKK